MRNEIRYCIMHSITLQGIATVLLQREREYVNAARLRCKETGSTETTQRYLEAASMLSTARMILIQDQMPMML